GTMGGAKKVLAACLKYAKERKAFGSSISEFGAIQHKLAEMAIRIYAGDSINWRSIGLIEGRLNGFSWDAPAASQTMLKAVEEFATECSIVKVFCSEALDYVVDEAVQIHGGYGYHQDYLVERAYRDSRINRIFEGTNEINRLLTTGMLLKRAAKGQLPLIPAAQALLGEALAGPSFSDNGEDGPLAAEKKITSNAKKITLLAAGVAFQRFMTGLENQQEVLAGISDIVMEAYAMESALLRTEKLIERGRGRHAFDMTAVFVRDAMGRIENAARGILAASSEGDGLRTNLTFLRRFTKF